MFQILLWSPWKYRCGQRTVRMAVVACSQKQRSLRAQAHQSKSRTETCELVKVKQKLLNIRAEKGERERLNKEPQVTQIIRSNRLRWLGHIWRSPENNQTRPYTFKNPMGSRTRVRPPKRWIDDVKNDLKTLNIKNWQRVAAYRCNWRKRAVEAAKTGNRITTSKRPNVHSWPARVRHLFSLLRKERTYVPKVLCLPPSPMLISQYNSYPVKFPPWNFDIGPN
ncbi:endonuclease-reverse transcriptase [Trichonephila clavipes]|nr:endonuclease-reverse transcriptase [Trichonephila clavipes]